MVEPTVVCLGGTITFTASGVTDSGGVKRVDCSAKQAIPPEPPHYSWLVVKPDGTVLTGEGDAATVTANLPGTYQCTFSVAALRDCPPPPLVIGPASGTAFKAEITTPNGDPTTSTGANATNEITYTYGTAPTASVSCAVAAVPDPSKLRWRIEDAGLIRATWAPHVSGNPYAGTGLASTATYTGMPVNYNDFGPKMITLTVDGLPNCEDTQVVEIFFPRDATNHPGGQIGSPNFYHYWSQTTANFGAHVYAAGNGTGYTSFESSAWVAHVSSAQGHTAGGTWNDAAGIDLFANIARHEEQHRLDLNAIWGPVDRVAVQDLDGDYLRDSLEPTLLPGWAYNPSDPDTFLDTWGYNQPPPNQPLRDVEHYALSRQAPWINGSANAEDWANPGMQHKTIGEPDD